MPPRYEGLRRKGASRVATPDSTSGRTRSRRKAPVNEGVSLLNNAVKIKKFHGEQKIDKNKTIYGFYINFMANS